MATLADDVRALYANNAREADGHRYTVPSPELYPFQWLWDSCFHANVLSHFDMDAARAEIRSAISHPLSDGLLPHIIYWKCDTRVTNWGRERRGDIIAEAMGTTGTSSITQPPIIAESIWKLHQRDEQHDFLHDVYPTICQHYEQLLLERDTDGWGLAGIVNPDESGEDNSPRFDHAQSLPVRHSNDENLEKRLLRMQQYRACAYDAEHCMRKLFWIVDVSFNVLLAENLLALSEIAGALGERTGQERYRTLGNEIKAAVKKHMCTAELCYSLDGNEGSAIAIDTWNVFMPLYGGLLSKAEAERLVESHLLSESEFWTPYPVPSVARDEPTYTTDDMWRGPTWAAINWFVYKGLKRYGFDDIACDVKNRTTALITRSGFREFYDPMTGVGLGARDFTWGGLVIDMD